MRPTHGTFILASGLIQLTVKEHADNHTTIGNYQFDLLDLSACAPSPQITSYCGPSRALTAEPKVPICVAFGLRPWSQQSERIVAVWHSNNNFFPSGTRTKWHMQLGSNPQSERVSYGTVSRSKKPLLRARGWNVPWGAVLSHARVVLCARNFTCMHNTREPRGSVGRAGAVLWASSLRASHHPPGVQSFGILVSIAVSS